MLCKCVKAMLKRNQITDRELDITGLQFKFWILCNNNNAKNANLDKAPMLHDPDLLRYLFRCLLQFNVTLNSKLRVIINLLKSQLVNKTQYIV